MMTFGRSIGGCGTKELELLFLMQDQKAPLMAPAAIPSDFDSDGFYLSIHRRDSFGRTHARCGTLCNFADTRA